MSLDAQFRAEIEKTLSAYEQQNHMISVEEAQAIYAIRHLLKNVSSVLQLRQELTIVIEDLEGHFFAFLPFVSDLKKELHALLVAPQYSLVKLFTAESSVLRAENEQLKKKLQSIEQHAQDFPVAQLPIKDVELYQKIAALEKEFSQAHQLLRLENRQIVQQLQGSQQECSRLQSIQKKLQTRAETAEAKAEILQIAILDKEAELDRLRSENIALKKTFAQQNGQDKCGSSSSYSILYQH